MGVGYGNVGSGVGVSVGMGVGVAVGNGVGGSVGMGVGYGNVGNGVGVSVGNGDGVGNGVGVGYGGVSVGNGVPEPGGEVGGGGPPGFGPPGFGRPGGGTRGPPPGVPGIDGLSRPGVNVTPATLSWGCWLEFGENDWCSAPNELVASATSLGFSPPGNANTPSRVSIPRSSRTTAMTMAAIWRAPGCTTSRSVASGPVTGLLALDKSGLRWLLAEAIDVAPNYGLAHRRRREPPTARRQTPPDRGALRGTFAASAAPNDPLAELPTVMCGQGHRRK